MSSTNTTITAAQAHRDALGEAFPILGEEYPNLVVLSPDVSISTRSTKFRDKFPDRFICTGISEQNTVSMAAGLSTAGWLPLVVGYAMFVSGKSWEPIRNSIAYPYLNVKIVATHAGINVGPDGVTHQCIEDIALMRSIPGMTILAPTDGNQVLPAIQTALEVDGPVYIRLERAAIPLMVTPDTPFTIGSSLLMRPGKDVTIIAIGSMVAAALEAAESLAAEKVEARVISMTSLKPLDKEAVVKAARETGALVTAEDHNIHGGLGDAVAAVLAQEFPAPLETVAVQDTFAESGKTEQLRDIYHLTPTDIIAAAHTAIRRRG
jgi:transketolase